MASSPPTIYHRTLTSANMNPLKNQEMFLDQLMKENFGLKLKIFHLEESSNKHSTLDRSTGNPELSHLIEGIKKELAEKNKQLMQARAMVFHYEKEIEQLNQELDIRPQREEFYVMEDEMKNMSVKLSDREKKLSEASKDVEKANIALETAEAMNEKLQAEIGEFNKEFRYRLESLEHEVSSQTLTPLVAYETKSIQADIEDPQHSMMKANCDSMAEELQDLKYKREMECQRVRDLEGQVQQLQNALLQRDMQVKSLMGQVESLKVEFSEDNNKTIQELKWKIEKSDSETKDMEAQLERKDKEALDLSNTLIEKEKEKWTMKGTLKELEAALVVSEAKLLQAGDDKDKYVKSLEKMHKEIEELSRQYQESVHSNGDCDEKDAIISQLQREVQLLNKRLSIRNCVTNKMSKDKMEVSGLTSGMKVDGHPSTVAEAASHSILREVNHKQGDSHETAKEHELVSQIRLAEQFVLEKEEDLFFMEETLRRSKKELHMALSDMAFYQELISHLQKDALMYLEFVQDIRSAAAIGYEERGQRSLQELVRAHLQKLDLRIEDSARPQLRLSCLEGSHESFGEDIMSGSESRVADNKGRDIEIRMKTADDVKNINNSCSKSTSADTAPSSSKYEAEASGSDQNLSSHGQYAKRLDDLSSRIYSSKVNGSSELASLESHYHKTLTPSTAQVADHIFVEDLLLYLKSQHKKMDENQNRLEKLEKQTSGCEEMTTGNSAVPKSAHISGTHSCLGDNTPSGSKQHQGQFRVSAPLSSSSCSSSSTTHHAPYHTHSFISRIGSTRGNASGIMQVPYASRPKACDERQVGQGLVTRELIPSEQNGEKISLGLDSTHPTKNMKKSWA